MYLNQSRISCEGSKKIYYAEYFVLGQILKIGADSPKNLEDVVLGERDVILIPLQIRPLQMFGRNNCWRGSNTDIFRLRVFENTKKSKILSSVQKERFPMHLEELCLIILSIAMKLSLFLLTSRKFIFFLPTTFDRSEEIDIYFNSVKLSSIDVEEDSFISNSKIIFDPSKLNINIPQEKKCFLEQLFKR